MSNHGLSTNRHLYEFREQIRFRETTMPMMVSIGATSADAKTRGNDLGNCRNSGICSNVGEIIQSGPAGKQRCHPVWG